MDAEGHGRGGAGRGGRLAAPGEAGTAARAYRLLARVVGVAGVLACAGIAGGQPLDRQLEVAVAQAKIGAATVGVSIIDASTGDDLAELRGGERFIPASNLKVLTSGAALLALGPEFEFRTEIVVLGDRVVIRGSGDPAFADPELLAAMGTSADAMLDRLADAVRLTGPEAVREVIADDRVFDREYVHPTWPRDQLNNWYCAEVSGLNFYANILQIYPVRGERAGAVPRIRTDPVAPWLEFQNRARTVDAGQNTFWVSREADANRFTLLGNVRASPEEPVRVTTHQGGLLLAELLAHRLERLGLAGPGGVVAARLAEHTEDLGGGVVAAVVRTPISTVLERCNTDSHNLYAECLLKRLGHSVTGQPGSWSNGAAVVRMQLAERVGHDAGSVVIVDGCGLSRENRVSPRTIASWLGLLSRDERVSSAFVTSLAGEGEGTLRKRFRGKALRYDVHAKSGYIDGVRTLSGYVTDSAEGRRVAFSILVNNVQPQFAGAVKNLHEDIVVMIDDWMARTAADSALGG